MTKGIGIDIGSEILEKESTEERLYGDVRALAENT